MKCSTCSAPVTPVTAVDIDGVLGQYHEHLVCFFENYFGREFPRGWNGQGNWEDFLGIPHSGYSQAKLAFRQGGLKRWMPTFDGAAQFTHDLHDLGAEVWITTTRPYLRLDSVDPDSREWLDRNSIYYDHLLYDDEKYSRLGQLVNSERVVAVLDDLPTQYAKAGLEFGWSVPTLMEADHNRYWRIHAEEERYRSMPNLEAAQVVVKEQIVTWQSFNA